jgi:uncharacterized protein (TIGR00369 family)
MTGDIQGASAFMRAAGLHLEHVTPTRVTGWIDLGPEHHQPWGLVHGGVYASAVEEAATAGAVATVADRGMLAVGVSNTTDFIRGIESGRVQVVAEPLQQGRVQQLWQVRITDADGRLVAAGQVRLQNMPPRR